MILACSDDKNCIKQLLQNLESKFPDLEFHLEIDGDYLISVNDEDILLSGNLEELKSFSDAFFTGWEEACDSYLV